MTIRKKYSKEFKPDAISLVMDQSYTRAEAARSLGINANSSLDGSKSCEKMMCRRLGATEN